MTPIVITSTPAVDTESLILDGLELVAAPFNIEDIDFGIPASLAEWVKGADSNGAILGRPPLYENRTITLRLQVRQQATMDAALAHVATIEDKLLECAQNTNGLALTWSPAESALAPITFRCLLGEVTDFPLDHIYWAKAPTLGIRLTCLPFGEGAEYLAGTVTNTDPMQTLELASVPGDVPALGRLVVTDAASQSRRFVAWGLESRWYPTASPPSLIVDSTVMTTTGFAGVTATRSGAYSGATNNVISATLRTQTQAICGLGDLTHIGSFRPHLRFYASATTMAVRLTFQALDGPMRSLTYRVPVAVGWNFVDLGLVSIPQAALGSQRWTGRIEAYSTATGGETFQADVVLLQPAQAYAFARASYAHTAGVLIGFDDFTGTTAGAALGTRAAPLGGSWDSSGAATDFTFTDTGGERLSRATVSSGARYAILGLPAPVTDQEVGVDVEVTAGLPETWLIARYVNATNFVAADLRYGNSAWRLFAYVGGVTTVLGEIPLTLSYTTYKLRLIVRASGHLIATLMNAAGAPVSEIRAYHSSLATGGALVSGRPGIADQNTNSAPSTRYYDNFYAATPASEPIVCYSGRSIEFRHNTTLRRDSTGTYSGPPPEYVGSRFYVPHAGGKTRKSRVAVVARRNDVVMAADDNIADSTTVEVRVTPRYLAVPRA